MFWPRLFSFIILVGVVAALLCDVKVLFGVLAALFSYAAMWEYTGLIAKKGRPSYRRSAALLGSMTVLFPLLSSMSLFFMAVPLCLASVLFLVALLFERNKEEAFEKVVNSASGLMLVAFPLSFLSVIYGMGDKWAFLYMVFVTKAGDTGAYVTGMLANRILKGGNHKMVPSMSPKKSWEGFFGGMAFSVLVSLIFFHFCDSLFMGSRIWVCVAIGVVLFLGGFAGDLAESVLKRVCGAKDSGAIIPGMGGVLDVLDSLMLNAPIFYFFMIAVYIYDFAIRA